MLPPLAELDDFVPGREDPTAAGWRWTHFDGELLSAILLVCPAKTETVVFYPQNNEVALVIDVETNQIVGIQIEDYDPKALR